MISYSPANPMKGRGAVRFKVDCRKPKNKERVSLVGHYLPNHYLCTGHAHYLSPEALNAPMEDLRQMEDRNHAKDLMDGKESQKARLLRDLDKIKKGVQKL